MLLRRSHGKAARPPVSPAARAPTEVPSLDGTLGVLERWVLSLPWVERAVTLTSDERIRGFAVVCPPLGCHAVWLSIGVADSRGRFDVHVVLTRPLACRGVASGWAEPLLEIGTDRVIVGVATPTTVEELGALQSLLGVAYNAAFRSGSETPQ